MNKKIIGCWFLILMVKTLLAQNTDTMLNMVLSKPFFYNVLQAKDGNIYTGTAEGIFKLEGGDLKPFSNQKGYITLNKEGIPVINPEGIKNYNEKKYLYLLPYPDQSRDEYHAGTNEHFYVCAGGRLHIFDILPYKYNYPNHSIRTISENFVGTYSGIYYKDKKLASPVPKYTEGYIKEYDGISFICAGALILLDAALLEQTPIDSAKLVLRFFKEIPDNAFTDILKSSIDQQFYIAAQKALFKTDAAFKALKPIYTCKEKKHGVCILGDYYNERIFFSDEAYLLKYIPTTQHVDTIHKFPEPILSGCTDTRHVYIIGNQALYVLNSDLSVEKLIDLEKAHSIVKVSSTELVIASDIGLFVFNTVSKQLLTLVAGVEFNRRALFIKNDVVYAGSINGLYAINTKDFNTLINKNTAKIKKNELPPFVVWGGLMVILLTVVLLIMLFYTQRKLLRTTSKIKELEKDPLDRKQIEAFIRENLSIASLKSIAEHFNTNNSHIYHLLEPEKPGSIIQKLRFEKVVEMRKNGANLEQITEATGLSESYIKKIKAT